MIIILINSNENILFLLVLSYFNQFYSISNLKSLSSVYRIHLHLRVEKFPEPDPKLARIEDPLACWLFDWVAQSFLQQAFTRKLLVFLVEEFVQEEVTVNKAEFVLEERVGGKDVLVAPV